MADLDRLKSYLPDYVNSITTRSKGNLYVCPVCGSGTGAKHTPAFSISPRPSEGGMRAFEWWQCFSGNHEKYGKAFGDIFELYAQINGCSNGDAIRELDAMYGDARGGTAPRARTTARAFSEAKQEPDQEGTQQNFADDIARFAGALEGSAGERYLLGRGIEADTQRRFHLGYDAQRDAIVIPFNGNGTYYTRRRLNPGPGKPAHDNLKDATMPLFNPAALYSSDVVFVVESPLCAISIEQAGGHAVALGGTNGGKRLFKQMDRKPTDAALVLCLDNDDAGRAATEKIAAVLDERGAFFVNGTVAITGDCKDPNDALQQGGADVLRQAVEYVVTETRSQRNAVAQEAEAERQQRTGAGMVDQFLATVQSRRYEPMPTGIADLDKAIGGGLIRQQLVLLGAPPGAGKTALAAQLLEGMAARGVHSIYLNMEMSREQLLARSLSRIATRSGAKILPVDILKGYQWTQAQRDAVYAAADIYKRNVAPRMIYNPDGLTANLDAVLSYINAEAQRAEAAGMAAPLVAVDYLQLLTGEPREDAATILKRAVAALKGFAVAHNSCVIAIVAHNRSANLKGDAGMTAARDTSALEYSADLQLVLSYTDCLKKNGGKSPDDLTAEERRHITLKVVKGRLATPGTQVNMNFDGESMTFTQLAHGDWGSAAIDATKLKAVY